jgi:hypothetical protein
MTENDMVWSPAREPANPTFTPMGRYLLLHSLLAAFPFHNYFVKTKHLCKTNKKTFFAFSLVFHIFGRGRFDPLNRNWGSLNPSNQTFSESI